jgi:peptidoglycan/xylan/chitin deacetylase (PgdA/CDA1 family)
MSYIVKPLYIVFIGFLWTCNLKEKTNDQHTDPVNNGIYQFALNKEVEITGLLYHRFGESKYPSTNISRELFRKQLDFLKSNNYYVITFQEAIGKLLSSGEKGRYIVITIDDAFNSFYSNGFPLLKEFGFKATLFINTETIGSGDYMGWEELRILSEYGIEIGNHTHSHDYFLNFDSLHRQQIFLEDVLTAQRLIEENLAIECKTFAYPFGEYDGMMKEEIKKSGFIGAAAQNSGVISSYSDLFALPRFPMTDLYGKMPVFQEKISMRPLPVVKVEPVSSIANRNPPVLNILLDNNEFDFKQLQCFVQGGNCTITTPDDINLSFRITSDRPLDSRRHLYTITIPDKNNKNWYWFSHQWVFPDVK